MSKLSRALIVFVIFLLNNNFDVQADTSIDDNVSLPDSAIRTRNAKSDVLGLVRADQGISLNKENYFLPLTYSEEYNEENTEIIFQFSFKVQLANIPLYLGYKQISFWQAYNTEASSPFRESNYNPEIFYRLSPEKISLAGWGTDIGLEHESNGRSVPLSRSWNRFYVAAYKPMDKSLIHVKLWYRFPEEEKTSSLDTSGDDNPDITDYYGYGEIRYKRILFRKQILSMMVRGNIKEGNGAFSLDYSIPAYSRDLYYQLRLWVGYGESLIDYNESIARIGIGVMLARW